ncbi:uncharacterized protein LOC108040083 [Drosophila rhopaloa]|uniref:Ephrin RBD domain-containing protein n=1 Tax=Drosophila rhopaloa TaxID=1041015 RepID=A0ABM5H0W0_DRORH|nr:uncharacterized protein LOC108040083 [Drosophila rhopaloa]
MPGSNEFMQLCKAMFTHPMRFVCSATIPEYLSKKYRNRIIKPEDPYSIFQLITQNSTYLLVFQFQDISECRNIQLNDLHTLDCENHRSQTSTLFFGFSHRMCYNYTMELTADLQRHCGADDLELNEQSGYYYTNQDVNFDMSLSTNAGRLLESPALVLYLIISLVLLALLRWKAP